MDYEDSDWDEESEGYDDDYYDDEDDDETDTISCPQCGADIYEDAESCPQCGDYIHRGHRPGYGSGWWSFGGAIDQWGPFWFFLAVAGTISVIFALMMF